MFTENTKLILLLIQYQINVIVTSQTNYVLISSIPSYNFVNQAQLNSAIVTALIPYATKALSDTYYAPYSTATNFNNFLTNTVPTFATTTIMNSAISTALIPYSTKILSDTYYAPYSTAVNLNNLQSFANNYVNPSIYNLNNMQNLLLPYKNLTWIGQNMCMYSCGCVGGPSYVTNNQTNFLYNIAYTATYVTDASSNYNGYGVYGGFNSTYAPSSVCNYTIYSTYGGITNSPLNFQMTTSGVFFINPLNSTGSIVPWNTSGILVVIPPFIAVCPVPNPVVILSIPSISASISNLNSLYISLNTLVGQNGQNIATLTSDYNGLNTASTQQEAQITALQTLTATQNATIFNLNNVVNTQAAIITASQKLNSTNMYVTTGCFNGNQNIGIAKYTINGPTILLCLTVSNPVTIYANNCSILATGVLPSGIIPITQNVYNSYGYGIINATNIPFSINILTSGTFIISRTDNLTLPYNPQSGGSVPLSSNYYCINYLIF